MALLGCENPISNAVFTADEDFLAALPSSERLGFPASFRARPTEGDEPLLQFATAAANDLDPLLTPIIFVGDVLRSTAPAERSTTHRVFRPQTLTPPAMAQVSRWWVRADLTRADEDADIRWQIDASQTADGPWEPLAEGRHDPDGLGDFTWFSDTFTAVVELDEPQQPLEVDYQDRLGDRPREVELQHPLAFGLPTSYRFVGEQSFGFSGTFDLLETGVPVPVLASVTLDVLGAGKGEAVVLQGETQTPFTSCWDANGDRVFSGGGLGVPMSGDATACPLFD